MQEYIEQGGIFIWPILFTSLWAFTLVIERVLFFNSNTSKYSKDSAQYFDYLNKNGLSSTFEMLEKESGLVAQILCEAWDPSHKTLTTAERGVEEVLHQNLPKLEKNIATIGTLASIEPLLGLLGTITGMIAVFTVIMKEGGMVDSSSLAGGISEAMITTQAGLVAAVPILLCHNFIRNKFKSVMADLQTVCAKGLKELERHGS
jgi:biopolymer transport protein ExbB